jgi:hypothetical protein
MVSPGEERTPLVEPTSVAQLPWEEAWLLAGRLQAEGIPARVFPESQETPISAAQMLPSLADLVAEVGLGRTSFQVLVSKERADEARTIVDEIQRGEPEETD